VAPSGESAFSERLGWANHL